MAAVELRRYLSLWQLGDRPGLTPEAATASMRRRSFRPHRIVPRVYVGSQADVRDAWSLYNRLLPEVMGLVVSTNVNRPTAQLELRHIHHPTHKRNSKSPNQMSDYDKSNRNSSTHHGSNNNNKNNSGGASAGRVLSVCAWNELKERITSSSQHAMPSGDTVAALADWLRTVLRDRSFRPQTAGEESEARITGGVVFFRLCLPWIDDPMFLLRESLDVAVPLMRAVVDGMGMAVVSHCLAGISRSVALVCAFLLRSWCDATGGSRSDDVVALDVVRTVVEFVRDVRLCACPNPGFTMQLAEYTAEILSYGK